MAELREKQRKFVDAYMGEAAGNATEAARLAGYKGNDVTLGQVGAENLKKPQILAAIEEIQNDSPLIASREERQQFWTSVMRGIEPDAAMGDRLKASELLGKSGADFVQKHEVEAKITEYAFTARRAKGS